MSLVATLICNPNNPALDSTILDGARAVLPSAGPAHWLWDEVEVYYRPLAPTFPGADDGFWPVTGMRRRPEVIFVPKSVSTVYALGDPLVDLGLG